MVGRIIKQLSNLYSVNVEQGLVQCSARGIFRKNELTPLVGDFVEISVASDNTGVIEKILPRKNAMSRPCLANVDLLFIIVSTVEPKPNFMVIDKMTVLALKNDIEPVIVINKTDLCEHEDLEQIYTSAGFKVVVASAVNKTGINEIIELINGKVTAFSGNSGVGKSSILNAIDSNLNIQTNEISQKLGRGKHTTRHNELYSVHGGYIADTPGFSSLEFENDDRIKKENLQYFFPEFEELIGTCKFTSCSHTKEKGCSILKALSNGEITQSRFESYKALHEQASKYNVWEF